MHGVAELALGQHPGGKCLEPGVEAGHDRRNALLADRDALLWRERVFVIPERTCAQVDLANERQRCSGVTGIARLRPARLIKFSPRMCQTSRVHQPQPPLLIQYTPSPGTE